MEGDLEYEQPQLTASEIATQRRNEEARKAKQERAAVRRITHRPRTPGGSLGGARSLDELRALAVEVGVSSGGFKDALVSRIRGQQKKDEAVAALAREKALKEARAGASNKVWKGQELMEQGHLAQAAAAFESALRTLADFTEDAAYRQANRLLKILRRKVTEMEGDLEYEQRQFLASQRAPTPAHLSKRQSAHVPPRAAMLQALSEPLLTLDNPDGFVPSSAVAATGGNDSEAKEQLSLPTIGRSAQQSTPQSAAALTLLSPTQQWRQRCNICSLTNPCPTHSVLHQRAHRVQEQRKLLTEAQDAEGEPGARAEILALNAEEAHVSLRFSEDIAAEAEQRRQAEQNTLIDAEQRRRDAFQRRKAAADRQWKAERRAQVCVLLSRNHARLLYLRTFYVYAICAGGVVLCADERHDQAEKQLRVEGRERRAVLARKTMQMESHLEMNDKRFVIHSLTNHIKTNHA